MAAVSGGPSVVGSSAPPRRPATSPVYTIPILNRILRIVCPCCTTSTTQLIIRPPQCFQRIGDCCMSLVDSFVLLLGPILILLASAIIFGLTHTFFYVMLPMLAAPGTAGDPNSGSDAGSDTVDTTTYFTKSIFLHISLVFFLLINVIHNYVLCVTTRNRGPTYDRIVRELADATGFRYPETPEEVADCRRDYEEKLIARGRARREMARKRRQQQQQQQQVQGQQGAGQQAAATQAAAANTGAGGTEQSNQCSSSQNENGNGSVSITIDGGTPTGSSASSPPVPASTPPAPPPPPQPSMPGWMLMAADEWGFCLKSNQPKPPRSHYDHVTKCLVLNMDHYCPWMFNTVGYMNYRYFCNFLLYVFLAMVYGTLLTLAPFLNMNRPLFREQVKLSKAAGHENVQHMLRMVPTPDERTAITFAFMLCLSIGIAISVLGGFHLYLMLTAQTTIEFHGNCAKKRGAVRRGARWNNPYSLGWKKNWQLVYGSRHPLLAILPSSREPEFLPIPIGGDLGRRRPQSKKEEGLPLVSTQEEWQRNEADVPSNNGGNDGTLSKRRAGAFAV